MTAIEREPLVNKLYFAFRQFQVPGPRIFRGMLGTRSLGNRKERRPPDQKAERYLAGCRPVGRGDFVEYAARAFPRARKRARMTKGAIANDRDAVLLAPGNHGLLDPTLLQMIEDLVACEPALTGDALGLLEIGYVKVA